MGTHTLEAAIVLCLMMSTLAWYVTLDPPTAGHDRVYALHKQIAADYLANSEAWPLPRNHCSGENLLTQLVMDGVTGNDSWWDRRYRAHFNYGIDADLYLNNMRTGLYPLYETVGTMGATEEIGWNPQFTYVKPIPPSDEIAPTNRLLIETAHIRQSHLEKLPGDALRYTASYDHESGSLNLERETTISTWSPVALQDKNATNTRGGAGNLTWALSRAPSLQREFRPHDLGNSIDFFVQIDPLWNQSGSIFVNVGTILTAQFPPDWDILLVQAADATVTIRQEEGEERRVQVELNAPQSAAYTIRFKLQAPSTPPARPFDVFRAELSNGTFGESSLVVTYPGATELGLPRYLYPTTPYPLLTESWGLFGAVLANGGSDEIVVHKFEIDVPGGYDLWHNHARGVPLFGGELEPIEPDVGSWAFVSAKKLRWTGELGIKAGEAGEFLVGASTTPHAANATSLAFHTRPSTSVGFANAHASLSTRWGKTPGFVLHEVLPANATGEAGYPTNVVLPSTHAYWTNSTSGPRVHQHGNYSIVTPAQARGVQDAVQNGSFRVRDRLVLPQGTVVADADMSSLADLAREATSLALDVDLYAPVSLGCQPTASWTQTTGGLPFSAIRAIKLHDEGPAANALLLGDDARAYLLNTAGAQRWRVDLDAVGTRSAVAADPQGGPQRIFVGDARGNVYRLDPHTGAIAWKATLDPAPNATHQVLALAASATHVLVGTSAGKAALLDASTGDEVGGPFASATPVGDVLLDGPDAYVQTSMGVAWNTLARLDTQTFTLQAQVPIGNGRILARSGGLLLSVEGNLVNARDPVSLASQGTTALPSGISHAARGKLTADAHDDLAFAHSDGAVTALDGATRQVLWHRLPPPGPPPAPFNRNAIGYPDEEMACEAATQEVRYYGQAPSCETILPDHPLQVRALAVGGGGVSVSGTDTRGARLLTYDAQGTTVHDPSLPPHNIHQSLARGTLGLDATLLAGTQQGQAQAWHAPQQSATWSATPTRFSGRFTFATPLPSGAFFGAHLLVATLRWTNPAGDAHEARLADWFEVVDADGRPVLAPIYELSLVVHDRGRPLG